MRYSVLRLPTAARALDPKAAHLKSVRVRVRCYCVRNDRALTPDRFTHLRNGRALGYILPAEAASSENRATTAAPLKHTELPVLFRE
jgi:hypothetical protein